MFISILLSFIEQLGTALNPIECLRHGTLSPVRYNECHYKHLSDVTIVFTGAGLGGWCSTIDPTQALHQHQLHGRNMPFLMLGCSTSVVAKVPAPNMNKEGGADRCNAHRCSRTQVLCCAQRRVRTGVILALPSGPDVRNGTINHRLKANSVPPDDSRGEATMTAQVFQL